MYAFRDTYMCTCICMYEARENVYVQGVLDMGEGQNPFNPTILGAHTVHLGSVLLGSLFISLPAIRQAPRCY